ncbi:hypothetical protein pEaSNUABM40_00296 [Erwinia phage pEa_SNUABM_40]|uniref:Uncharacterized protein n=1 Tax=Erwinia phage pEa_SNUABM_3 TaxID=2869552 RepID=A0AAE7XJC6_9CAUD|nr:hypothetical protein MPK68_gp294 [Erwinia phage pEa_SNUABM_3]QZE56828.1 hypothetical protein pEaSNUABM20_00292 [Erwinia phage pEa_SNUABM_20]QZE58512.1 hypothetical protein pEaSNUABM40_00296 [Erwinia phage pEa_SNUABM_40]UAW53073.1 hypothetical protein pEaSNUABM23_00291 [Erwinia phage pEa_SNUABM_23]UIW10968.1 hypothetical protein pEaSNUABM23_00291 [Erwinia phage pEa_SNUABM_31]QZE56491.1 hypothetical protein pEaSNUABM3_00294 [Erwinia phage pEa_SNUABM_3]
MARYHVFSATHKYYGEAYQGTWLKEIALNGQQVSEAEFKDFETAKECADKLHQVCDIGWIVYNAFSERAMYDTRTESQESVNN